MEKTIALLGAFDTKGVEYAFVRDCLNRQGLGTFLIDVGTFENSNLKADVPASEVASSAGHDLAALRAANDRGAVMAAMSDGVAGLVPQLYAEGRFDGILALGGTGGTSVACRAMRELPLGVPKVMVSTVAGTDVSGYVGVKDIVMVPSIVDVAGINELSRRVFSQAAGLIAGMVLTELPEVETKPLVAASMFGNTTTAVDLARELLTEAGYEVLVFHCTGTGGKTLESLVEAGLIAGVLDLTTTEWADEVVGGVLAAGPDRLCAAARTGTPAIVVPGCLDMVNFWAPNTIPDRFEGRTFYEHNPDITLMRTNVEECCQIGAEIGQRVSASTGPVTVLIPTRGLSMIDVEGGAFWAPEADRALFESLKANLRADIPVVEMDCVVNDPVFARKCAETLLELMQSH